MGGEAAQAEAKQKADIAGPVAVGPDPVVASFASAGTRSHEHAILRLQQTAGNRAVGALFGGIQRAPVFPAIQRAPAASPARDAGSAPRSGVQRAPDDDGGPQLTPEARVDRLLLHAIKPGYDKFEIDYDKADELLSGMTVADGQAVRDDFRTRDASKGWDLEQVIAGTMDYTPDVAHGGFPGLLGSYQRRGVKIGNNLGPKNRQRLLALLRGTNVGQQVDPAAVASAIETTATFAKLVGVEVDPELVSTVSATVAVAVRDQNAREVVDVRGRRATAQAISIKSWLDRGMKDKVFQLLRKLAQPHASEDKKAVLAAFPKDVGEELFLLLSRKLKGRDLERATALYLGDITGADRAALHGELEQYQATKTQVDKLPEASEGGGGLFGPVSARSLAIRKLLEQRLRIDRDRLEAHVAALKKETMPGPGLAGRTRLDDVLARDREGERLSDELGIATDEPARPATPAGPAKGTGAGQAAGGGAVAGKPSILRASDRTVVGAVAQAELPVLLARKLRRADREGQLKASQLEEAFGELHDAAVTEARKRIDANPKLQDETVAIKYQAEVVNAFFTYFTSTFDLEDPKRPLDEVIGMTGGLADRGRNRELYEGRGEIPEWRQLDFALRFDPKDFERARQILAGKRRSEIGEISAEYTKHTVDRFGKPRDLKTDLLGSHEYQMALRDPGTAPQLVVMLDIDKAREQYSERLSWLQGDAYEPDPRGADLDDPDAPATEAGPAEDGSQSAGFAARSEEGGERAPGLPTRLTARFSGPPSTSMDLNRARVAAERRKDALHKEAEWLFSRITGTYGRVIDNRGTFARFRDWTGNTQRKIVNDTRDAALDAFRQLDKALLVVPPNLELATQQIKKLHLVKARMDYNIPVYKEATEAAFNEFVDFAVLVVTTLATFGNAGPIIMAIRATAATILTKAMMKGGDYSADEFWGDIKGGALSAGAGKLGEKVLHGIGAAYLKKATDRGWNQKWIGIAIEAIPKPIKDHVAGLISGEIQAGAEAVIEGDPSRLLTPLRLESQATGAGQMLTHGAMRRGGNYARTKQQQRTERKAAAAKRAAGERAKGAAETAAPTTSRPEIATSDLGTGIEPIGPATSQPSLALPVAGGDRGATRDVGPTAPADGGDSLRSVSPTLGGGLEAPTAPRRAGAARTTGREQPLTREEFEVPPATRTAAELNDPKLTTPRRLRNREEQLRRDGQLPGPDGVVPGRAYDAELLAQSTGPTGGRRFAAEFTPIREGWLEAPLAVRGTRIGTVVNKILADSGMPRVQVIVDANLAAGNAAFSPLEWTLTVSAKDVLDPSPEGFAELANAVAHETRHALHIFRGVRAGLDSNPGLTVPVRSDVLERARTVNQKGGFDEPFRLPDRRNPADRGSLAYGEAAEIIQETFGPGTADRPTAISAGNAAVVAGEELRTALNESEAASSARPVDPIRVHRAEERVARARVREREAHNNYVKTAPEADAHRAGPAAGKATLELLQHQQRVVDAESFAQRATTELDAAMVSGDAGRIRDAITRAEALQKRVKAARAALDALAPARVGPELAASLGAEPLVPPPAKATEVLPVPAPRRPRMPATTPPASGISVPSGPAVLPGPAPAASGPAVPGPRLPGARLRSVKPAGGDNTTKPPVGPGAAHSGSSDGQARNELLDWAAEQAGPALQAAEARLTAARSTRRESEQRLAEARDAGGIGGLELENALAKAKESDAEVALGQAQAMAVRGRRVIEGIKDLGARTASSGNQTDGPGASDGNELLDWAREQAGPALKAAEQRLAKARAAREQAEKQLADARTAGGIGRLELEISLAKATEGDAEMALGEAQKMAVRGRVVIEGIERSRAEAARRAAQRTVEAIDEPEVAARIYIEQRGARGRNLALQRKKFEAEWQGVHRQDREAPIAGWRRADGTVVIDMSNADVRAAVERMAGNKAGELAHRDERPFPSDANFRDVIDRALAEPAASERSETAGDHPTSTGLTIERELAGSPSAPRRQELEALRQRIEAKPLRALTPDEFRMSEAVQQRMFDAAKEAVQRMEALGHKILGAAQGEVESLLKRNKFGEFVDGILEKCKRKGYKRIGEMDDIIRGRIDVVDGAEARRVAAEMEDQETIRTVDDPRINDAGVTRYPRSHVIVYDQPSGLIHEWQIGTKSTTDLYETEGIQIPPKLEEAAAKLGKKFKKDLHDIEYDVFQVVKKRYPALAARVGIDGFIARTAEASQRSAAGSANTSLAKDIEMLHAEASVMLTKIVEQLGPVAVASMFH